MTKKQFATLVFTTVSGLIFALGMCMCLLPEWDSFVPGVILTAIGGVMLIALGVIALVKSGFTLSGVNWKLVGKIAYATLSLLVLGCGMALIMSWDMLLFGIAVGAVGIIMLLSIIPMFFGFRG